MANPEHLNILKAGIAVWNKWRENNPEVRPNLYGANLRGRNLTEAEFRNANLTYADLRRARLNNSSFWGADISEANLTAAILSGASLINVSLNQARLKGANLKGVALYDADLREAELDHADLSSAVLRNVNLSGATVGETVFHDNDLSTAVGLEAVEHKGPSIISFLTLAKSKGQVPASFLRGCGLSDWEIESAKLYDPDLSNDQINDIQYRIYGLRVSRALQINPIFISYSHADSAFVDGVERHLTKQGIRFWRDVRHAVAGPLEQQVDAAIHLNGLVLLVLSKHSTNSDWVEHEARMAREKTKQSGKHALCPVALARLYPI